MNLDFSKNKFMLLILVALFIIIGLYNVKVHGNNNSKLLFYDKSNSEDLIIDNNIKEEESNELFCHIDGAIKNPGLYKFKKGDRLKDIIDLAGGFNQDANLENINLSIKIKDEMKIHIPSKNEKNNSEVSEKIINSNLNKIVNVNSDDIEKIKSLPGIGEGKAKKIIEFRNKNKFESIEEIKNVDGIGEKTFEALKDLITVD